MAYALRKTGIPIMEEISWGTHIALFYETEEDLLDTCAGYFAAGLQNNEFCTWAVAEPATVEMARQALSNRVSDFDRYQAAGGVELVPGNELDFSGGTFDPRALVVRWRTKLQHAIAGGYDGLRASGNAWAAAASHPKEFYSDASELVRVLEDQPMLALETYDLGVSRAVDVLDVVRVHHLTVARRRGDWQLVETLESEQAGVRIRGLNDAFAIMSTTFPGHELLTGRERAVLAQIVTGASSKEIARELGVSPRTVDFHRANILHKLGARNTAEVIRAVLSRE